MLAVFEQHYPVKRVKKTLAITGHVGFDFDLVKQLPTSF
jgi:hypothetical protein